MGRRIFGLLVGVNDYPDSVGNLYGALNDVDHYSQYLTDNYPKDSLCLEVLKNSDATRPNIIKSFREHLCRAAKDDVVLFQYSGHGARWKSAQNFNRFYPEGYDEGLVCYDSRRGNGNFDLADKELAVLVSEASRSGAHVAIVLDSCHSGSGTRSADDMVQLKSRLTHTVDEERPLESYLDGYYSKRMGRGDSITMPVSQHILLAACERDKQAFESSARRGIFSTMLLELLAKHGSDISYADLFVRIRATIGRVALGQTPQFEVSQGFNSNMGFLGRTVSSRPRRFTTYFDDASGSWQVGCGALNGLVQTSSKPTSLLIFEEDGEEVIANGNATAIDLSKSNIEIDKQLDLTARYQAELTSLPVPMIAIDVIASDEVQDRVEKYQAENSEFLNLALATRGPACCEYRIIEEQGNLIFRRKDGQLIMGVEGIGEASVQFLFESCLRPVSRWEHLLGLQNRSKEVDTTILPFSLEVVGTGRHAGTYDESLRCLLAPGEQIECRLKVKNLSGQRMYLALIHLDDEYKISALYEDEVPAGDSEVTLKIGKRDPFGMGLKEKDGDWATHRFKLFASPKKIDTFRINQKKIEVGKIVQPTVSRSLFLDESDAREQPNEISWFAQTITVDLVADKASVDSTQTEVANGQIQIKGHPAFKAQVAVCGPPLNGRGVGGSDFALALEQQGLELINWSSSRGAPATTLELNHIENSESLTDQPLEIQLNSTLDDNEYILPIVFDGTHVLLAGEAGKNDEGKTNVTIRQLPTRDDGSRGVFNSIKFFFFKTVLQQKNVNQLSWFEFDENGDIRQHKDAFTKKFAAAKNVLILVHGFLSESKSMARGLFNHLEQSKIPLHQQFDLVLGYDFENLNTSIPETAVDFEKQLVAAGFGKDDDKNVTILAHSMGGLIARQFIEQGVGKDCVDSLIMCGTPNNGTPFGKMEQGRKILTLLTSMVLNPITLPITGAAGILASLMSLTVHSGMVTKAIDNLDPEGEFLRNLNASPDPGVQYITLAGDYRAISESTGLFERLLNKLNVKKLSDWVFGGRSNDFAVSVESANAINPARKPPAKSAELGCYHLTFFDEMQTFNEIWNSTPSIDGTTCNARPESKSSNDSKSQEANLSPAGKSSSPGDMKQDLGNIESVAMMDKPKVSFDELQTVMDLNNNLGNREAKVDALRAAAKNVDASAANLEEVELFELADKMRKLADNLRSSSRMLGARK